METQTKINSAIAIIILLISGYVIVGDTSLEPTHYCEEKQIKAFCYSLSSTMKTCYTEMNNTGGKRCDIWKKIGSIDEVPIDNYINPGELIKWRCNNINCTRIS